MTELAFRNVDVDPDSEVADWPAEAIETALDRGSLVDWRRIAAEIRRSPWGRVARIVERITGWDEHPGVDALMAVVVEEARRGLTHSGRRRYADSICELRRSTGLGMRDFAKLAGTSASRLSDYENARVAPTTDTLARLHHAAAVALDCDEPPEATP